MKVSIHTDSRIGTRLAVARVSKVRVTLWVTFRVRVRLGVVVGLELGLRLGLGLFRLLPAILPHLTFIAN